MDNLIFIILFVLPGVFIETLYKKYTSKPKKEPSDYEKAIIAFQYSAVVLLINLLVIKKVSKNNILSIDNLQNKFSSIEFLFKYLILTFITSIIFAVVWYFLYRKGFHRIYNWVRSKSNKPVETIFQSVWEEIFENSKVNLNDRIISIEKDGQIITQGFLASYSGPQNENKEFGLMYSETVKEYFERDKTLPPRERFLNCIDYEYYDLSTGHLIKIYDSVKVCEDMNNR